ncbi:phosphoribosylaminoimidazole carboxylase [Lutibacter sp. A80]|uniref:phosphoribosylaminoimidazole carboxylase n=1 Tax=Lutibacter sp. A80 TaxID=2918453 RepID=UPI001F0688C2|nr:phosphoribosylaminoimidazole carboxylase [Lutibacter sp. A80]UMB60085.1 phosphoribosylaminoimidazole carboxylase [Lutibacter sp. A80]
MRKLSLLFLVLLFISCEKNETNDILPEYSFSVTVNLNLPQYIELQAPGGWAYNTGGIQGIIIQNIGIGSPPYKAFELACPNYDCNSPMEFDGSLKLKCPCDDSEYSIYDGSPQTEGNIHFAREYKVTQSGSSLNITNF